MTLYEFASTSALGILVAVLPFLLLAQYIGLLLTQKDLNQVCTCTNPECLHVTRYYLLTKSTKEKTYASCPRCGEGIFYLSRKTPKGVKVARMSTIQTLVYKVKEFREDQIK